MKKIVSYINKLLKERAKYSYLLVFAISLSLFLINAFYVNYPDEFVNIMAGKYINWGKLPYRDFFDHHLPFAWYFSAIIQWFSFGSYVIFRFWWALIVFFSFFLLGIYLRKTNPGLFKYYLVFVLLYPLIGVYYWLHLFLADSLAAWFFCLVFWLITNETYLKKVNKRVIYICSFLLFCLIFSSMTFVYLAGVIYLWLLYLLIKDKFSFKLVLNFIGICILPYFLYFLYLLVTGTLKEFYISNIVYNTKLYMDIPNYTKGGHFFNPLKFAFTVIFNFQQKYLPLLTKIKDLDFYLRGEVLFGLSTFLYLFLLFFENKFLFVLFFLILSFSNPRSDIFILNETNYQAGIFIVLGLSCSLLVLWKQGIVIFKDDYLNSFKKIMVTLLFTLLLFNGLFLAKNTYDKWFQRYTQKMPGINNLAYSAVFIDDILTEKDFFWVGPYEPNEVFFVKKARPAGKFITLLPQFREDDYFKNGFLEQFVKNPPTIIIFKHDASIFMTPAVEFGKFFLEWMNGRYVSIEELKTIEVLNTPSSFNLRTDLYLRKGEESRLLEVLRAKGYIK